MPSRPSSAKPFSRLRFRQYAHDLEQAVYALSREGEPVSFLPSSRTIPHPVLAEETGSSTPLPTVSIQRETIPMTAPAPGSFAASIRAMMDEARAGVAQARAEGLAKVGEAVTKLNEAKAATAQVAHSMAKTIADEADAVMSELGQISNLPPK